MEEKKEISSEKQNQASRESENELTLGKVVLGSKNLGFYFALIKYPISFAVAASIIYFFVKGNFKLAWIFDFLAFGFIAVVLVKIHKLRYKEIVIACGFAGLFIGVFSALFKLIYSWKIYYFFNLVSEPAITAMVGIFFGIAVGYVLLNIFSADKKINKGNSSSNEEKGGESNGRRKERG